MKSIKEIVKNEKAYFQYYVDGNLWYKTTTNFEFPIPIEDTKGGIFFFEHDAITLMRWIRLHLETMKGENE